MSRERPLTIGEKWKVYWARHNPRKKMKLGDAYTEIRPSKPMDFNTEGAPAYWKEKTIIVVGFMFWSVMWFVTDACIRQTYVMDLVLLTNLILASNALAGMAVVACIYVLIDAHKGTFQYYWMVLEVVLRFLDGRAPYRAELRVKDHQKLWPLNKDQRKIIESMEKEVEEDYEEMYEDSLKGKKKNVLERVKDGIDELIEVFHS